MLRKVFMKEQTYSLVIYQIRNSLLQLGTKPDYLQTSNPY